MKKMKIRKMTDHRYFYEFEEKNNKGENIVIEVTECYSDGNKDSLPYLWKKNGYINKILFSYYSIDTFVTDEKGNCRMKYNPTVKLSDDKKRYVINFDWMLEVNENNLQRILNEIEKLAFSESEVK